MYRSKLVQITILLFVSSMLVACGGQATPEPTAIPPTPVPPTDVPPTEAPPPTDVPPAPEGIARAYTVAGTNPDGSAYDGTLRVTATGDTYQWAWDFGGDEYLGVGIQQENVVSLAWGGEECYVASYVVQDDGVLNGLWTGLGQSSVGTDVGTPTDSIAEGDIAGTYNAAGTDSGDGSAYGCMLDVTADGDVYTWEWYMCGEFTGVGIMRENIVSVAYGSENCSAISYIVQDDGVLDGIWAYVGQTDLGADVATPSE